MSSEINDFKVPLKIQENLLKLGIQENEINAETAINLSLYLQALKGNISAINAIKKQFKDEENIIKEKKANDITALVKKEERKIKKSLVNLSEEQIKVNADLIHNIAFQSVTLRELTEDIAKNGVKEKYKNGANQWGFKDRTEVKTYNNMFKNYQSSMKQLNDIIYQNEIIKKQSKKTEDEFDKFGEEE
jgi:hypothetical protein|nr:MAG TPA: hypothetical protein [Caudoviricetes sp.]